MVWVSPYIRIREGVLQHVRGHWRRFPHSLRKSATLVPFPHPSKA